MDRLTNYAGAIPLETDLLNTNKNVMVGLGYALQSILGGSTLFDGLACTPTAPASLQVSIAAGSCTTLAAADGSAYSSLAADSHQIVKQGIMEDPLLLTCPAPTTTGFSINYLIQAEYADSDTDAEVLDYYNSTDPGEPFSGPGNSGSANYTFRRGVISISAKAGAAAATGTQTTPAPNSGYTGLYVVTVANGQTTINSGNIAVASGAPFIGEKLTAKISQSTADGRYLQQSNNLSDLPGLAAALGHLGFAAASGKISIPNAANPTAPFTILYGTSTMTSTTSQTTNFSPAFPNGLLIAFAQDVGAGSHPLGCNATMTQLNVYSSVSVTVTYNWFALGY